MCKYGNHVPFITLKSVPDIFMKLGKALSDNLQRTRTVTPPILFTELCPYMINGVKMVSSFNLKVVQDIFKKCGTKRNH